MRLAASAMFLSAGTIGACGYYPSVMHPTLAAPKAADIALTCEQIDLAVDRADTVRWVIRDDGGELETDKARAGRYSVNVLVVTLSMLAMMPTALPDGGHSVLDAADARLLALVTLKRDRRCPARATTFPDKDEFALAAEIDVLQVRITGEEGWSKPILEERTRLLDGLRVLPPVD